jgi:hypothetical protein
MHFGPLRSLLHSSDPSQTSFDEILRHLLNVSWWEDPRIVEECLAYAEAGLSRWPDITRSLHVSKMEVQFLENIFIWGALLRGIWLRRVPEFVPQMIDAIEKEELRELRFLSIDDGDVSGAQFDVIGQGIRALEGFHISTRNYRCDFDLQALRPAMNELKWLVIKGSIDLEEHARMLDVCKELVYIDVPLRADNVHLFTRARFPNLRYISADSALADNILGLIDHATLDEVTLLEPNRFWHNSYLAESIRARGWRIATHRELNESSPIPFLSMV